MNEITNFQKILNYGERREGHPYLVTEVTKFFRRALKDSDLVIKTVRDPVVDYNQIVIGGMYDPAEDEDNFSSVAIYVYYNPDQKFIRIEDVEWYNVCINFIECLGHEKVHQRQWRSRKFDSPEVMFLSTTKDKTKREEQEYLGNPDEIEAYAYSIACDTLLRFNLREINGKMLCRNDMFRTYVKSFGHNHPVVRELIRYTVNFYNDMIGDGNGKRPRIRGTIRRRRITG